MTLAHLDMLIAYTVVMLGVSLIVTVLTQLVSASLGLRGTNLFWGIKMLLQTIDPELEPHAEAILTHPMVSDSLLSRFGGRFRAVPLAGRLVRRWTLATAIRPAEIVTALAARAQEFRAAGGEANLTAAMRIDRALDASLAMEARFHSAMDRVSQRFASQMRIWTVFFSFAIALLVQLDTFRLLERLWTDPQMRASMVNTRGAMMQEAEAIVRLPEHDAQTAVSGAEPQVYEAAFEQLKGRHPAETGGMGDMPAAASYEAARIWLANELQSNEKRIGASDANNPAIIQDYTKCVVAALGDRANSIRRQIETSGLDLLPQPYRFFHFDGYRNFLGTMVSAVLLSLGAPFWFNALKSLTNLRPVLANKQDAGA